MSECGPDCNCPEQLARKLLLAHGLDDVAHNPKMVSALAAMIGTSVGKCPQDCGKQWPECGCPTMGMSGLIAKRATVKTVPRRLRQSKSKGLSIAEMMNGL